jgi:hypothetical protein
LLLVVRGHRGEDIRSISASLKASAGAELWGRQDQRGPATPAASPGLLGRVPTRAATANQLRRVPRSCSASAKLPRFNFWMRSQKIAGSIPGRCDSPPAIAEHVSEIREPFLPCGVYP